MSDRIVITGAGGLLGRTLVFAAGGREVLALTSADCDITDPVAVQRRVSAGDVVINCAAYTKVDEAERDEARAYAVNATGAENVAQACARVGARLIHVSTDYVFSGRFEGEQRPYEIDDETNPLSAYGRTKLAGEVKVLAALPDANVVRTSWIFGGEADFVAAIGKKAAGADDVDVVADQVGGPTYVGDLAQALLDVASRAISEPVLHVANAGAASRYEQARAVFELLGADPERVRPVGTDRHPRPAPRPAYSVLSAHRSTEAGVAPLRPWRDALAVALASGGPESGVDSPLPSTP
ncbi:MULTISPECIES: dTDP-4-dehydrorhamnose reductase [unclassified Mycobacterium]|uniref:dTDP-4-dehydrorhamnose reductase n=1 Tax=unclassified Mycobacterium TaxID=2642494 RepID=UPI0029C6293D|nr:MULTISPECIES: dTDP-4-dehydrorhamnose reductase [unclassified Mycobacterium]